VGKERSYGFAQERNLSLMFQEKPLPDKMIQLRSQKPQDEKKNEMEEEKVGAQVPAIPQEVKDDQEKRSNGNIPEKKLKREDEPRKKKANWTFAIADGMLTALAGFIIWRLLFEFPS